MNPLSVYNNDKKETNPLGQHLTGNIAMFAALRDSHRAKAESQLGELASVISIPNLNFTI